MTTTDALNRIAALDTIISNPARLMIIYLLDRQGKTDYLSLMDQTRLSSGNITTHLGKLAQSGYIKIKKSFRGNKPHTAIEISAAGKAAYQNWAEQIMVAFPSEVFTKLSKALLIQEAKLNRYHLIWKDWLPLASRPERYAGNALHGLERIPWPPLEELWTS